MKHHIGQDLAVDVVGDDVSHQDIVREKVDAVGREVCIDMFFVFSLNRLKFKKKSLDEKFLMSAKQHISIYMLLISMTSNGFFWLFMPALIKHCFYWPLLLPQQSKSEVSTARQTSGSSLYSLRQVCRFF